MMFIARDSISAADYKISQDGQRGELNLAGVKGIDENSANRAECANHRLHGTGDNWRHTRTCW